MEISRSFEILLSRRLQVEAALVGLAKRAARKGLTPLAHAWGKPFTVEATKEVPATTRVPLTLLGDTPHFAGWSFAATLQHLDGENIVRALPFSSEPLPVVFRTRGATCDHCKTARRRNDTYVLRHENGRFVQVGSTCLADFLGTDTAGNLAARAEMLVFVDALASDEASSEGDSYAAERTIADFLPFVAFCVRELGWISRTTARDRNVQSTADCAWVYLTDAKARALAAVEVKEEEDLELAKQAELWAESLSDDTVNAESGNYLHNLRAVARAGLVGSRTAGIAASIVVAYQRATGQARLSAAKKVLQNDVHVGTVGKRETFRVTLDFVTGFDTAYGYTTILKFKDESGAVLVWKASNTDLSRSDVGREFTLTGMVKEYGEYKGAKQTMVTRCTLVAQEMGKAGT